MTELLFPFSEYWHIYVWFNVGVLALLLLDLGVFHKNAHEVKFKEAAIWSVVWISLALLFNFGLYHYCLYNFPLNERLMAIPGFDPQVAAKTVSLEYLTGYIVEKSLSVDNIFVFIVVFTYFKIPEIYRHRILFYGILGALFFRAIFIALGSVLMQYHWVVLGFGVLIIITGIKMLLPQKEVTDLEKNIVLRMLRKFLPVSSKFHGQKFFAVENGKRVATPLFVALVFLEFSDIVFAVDSVPAIFGITREPLIVFTSNIFAILGLRSLYFLLAGTLERLRFIKYGLATILVFVGLKMVYLNDAFGGKFPISWSLSFIVGVLALTTVISLALPAKEAPKGQPPQL